MKNDTSMKRRKTGRAEPFERPHLENRMQLLGDRLEKSPIYEVEPEIIQWAKLYTDVYLERWTKGNQPHWNSEEKRNNYIGMIGHKCFEMVLQQYEIPYAPNDPTIDWRQQKKYDFRIPAIGTIEIKTVDFKENQRRVLVKCTEWHHNDYCVAIKLEDATPTKARIMGYATCKEVLKFQYAENEFPCKIAPCYWEYLENLHPSNEFIEMLKTKTASLWNEQET